MGRWCVSDRLIDIQSLQLMKGDLLLMVIIINKLHFAKIISLKFVTVKPRCCVIYSSKLM
jgi:hypothetical protein